MSATPLWGVSSPVAELPGLSPSDPQARPASGAEPPRPLSLTTKLAEVMAAVGRIAKRGRNEFHGYDYATEADIVEAVRAELAKRHILIYPEVVDYEVRELSAAHDKKAARLLTILRLRFLIEDGSSGERIERQWLGAGEDSGDKGVYKAMTGGDKYFLLKLFLIPTGDDPERDTRKAPTAAGAKRPPVNTTTGEILDDPLPVVDHDPVQGNGVLLAGVELFKKGESDKGPWTMFLVRTTDGAEYVTFDADKADQASDYAAQQRPVEIKSEKKKGKQRALLLALTPLHQAGEETIL